MNDFLPQRQIRRQNIEEAYRHYVHESHFLFMDMHRMQVIVADQILQCHMKDEKGYLAKWRAFKDTLDNLSKAEFKELQMEVIATRRKVMVKVKEEAMVSCMPLLITMPSPDFIIDAGFGVVLFLLGMWMWDRWYYRRFRK